MSATKSYLRRKSLILRASQSTSQTSQERRSSYSLQIGSLACYYIQGSDFISDGDTAGNFLTARYDYAALSTNIG
jgi:hypothetical protein